MKVTALILCTTGCTDGRPYAVTSIEGTVTYDDGSLIPSDDVRLSFVSQEPPIDPKTYPRVGMVRLNPKDGTFKGVTTYEYADGVIEGRHKVAVNAVSQDGKPLVPDEYKSEKTTPIEIHSDDSPLTIRIPKPK